MLQVHKSTHNVIRFHQSKENEDEVSPTAGWHHKVYHEIQNSNTQQQPESLPKFFGTMTLGMRDVIDCVVISRLIIKFHVLTVLKVRSNRRK
jgi:hypothetical protein